MAKINVKSDVKKILINDFSKRSKINQNASDEILCNHAFNFNISNGKIEKGLGIRPYRAYMENSASANQHELNFRNLGIESINKVMYFKQYFSEVNQTTHRLLIHAGDKKLYLYPMFSGTNSINWVYELEFESIPAVLEYKKDGLDSILISATDKLVVWPTGQTPYQITGVPVITSMCVYNDVLYCSVEGDSEKIWYTTNLNPESIGTETEHTKSITLDGVAGGAKKMIVLKENMYVFCDYGIYRINTYAKSEPTAHQVYIFNGTICKNTIIVCGDEVLFMTSEGLYKFSGTSVSKIAELEKLLHNSKNNNAVATYLKGNYYFATDIDFEDNMAVGSEYGNILKNNSLVKLDIHTNKFEVLRGVDIKDMLALKAGVEEKVLVTFNTTYCDEVGEITDDGMQFESMFDKVYRTNDIIKEGTDKIVIRNIVIDASEGIDMYIYNKQGRVLFRTYCDGVNKFRTILPCTKFYIEVIGTTADSNVRFIEMEYIKSK